MELSIKNILQNSLLVIRASFFEWIKSRRFLLFEKRLFVAVLLTGILLLISSKTPQANPAFSKSDSDFSERLEMAEKKLRNGSGWKPLEVGDNALITELPEIFAGAVIAVDSGKVLWSKNLQSKVAPASLSKLATIITAIDISELDNKLEVFEDASSQVPTKLGLKTGEKLTLSEAIAAAVLTSANDATQTIASSLGDSIGNGPSDFMRLVNLKMQKIGAYESHLVTATGIDDPDHFSTVYDLAIVAYEAYKNYPYIAEVAATDYKRLNPNDDHKLFDLPNWNALLGVYPGVDGLKIGYTEKAGHSTIVTAKRDGINLMAIVIGAKTLEERELAAAALLNWGFGKYGIEAFSVSEADLVKRFEDWRRQLSYVNN